MEHSAGHLGSSILASQGRLGLLSALMCAPDNPVNRSQGFKTMVSMFRSTTRHLDQAFQPFAVRAVNLVLVFDNNGTVKSSLLEDAKDAAMDLLDRPTRYKRIITRTFNGD